MLPPYCKPFESSRHRYISATGDQPVSSITVKLITTTTIWRSITRTTIHQHRKREMNKRKRKKKKKTKS